MTAPQDVADVYRNVNTLNWDGHLNQILTNFGFKGDCLKLAWHKPIDGDPPHKSPRHEPTKPSEMSIRRKNRLDRIRQAFENVTGSFSHRTYNRADSFGGQDDNQSGASRASEQYILPLERVHLKQSLEVHNEHV